MKKVRSYCVLSEAEFPLSNSADTLEGAKEIAARRAKMTATYRSVIFKLELWCTYKKGPYGQRLVEFEPGAILAPSPAPPPCG